MTPGPVTFAFGTSSFGAWLQTAFLPNARDAVRRDAVPTTTQVGVRAMREYDYQSSVPEAIRLVELLSEFDSLVLDSLVEDR